MKRLFWISLLAAIIYGLWLWQGASLSEVGFLHDDGIYIILAKAISLGEGYSLIQSSPTIPMVKYPPLFPLWLTPAWLISPEFPLNGNHFYVLSIIPWALASIAFINYIHHERRLPVSWSILTYLLGFTTLQTFIIGASVMSEGLYLLLSVVVLYIAEYGLRTDKLESRRLAITLAILVALTCHTRLAGLTLAAAIGLILLIRKQWKSLKVYSLTLVATVFLPMGSWLWHASSTSPNDKGAEYSNYLTLFKHNTTLENIGFRIQETAGSLISKLGNMMFPLFTDPINTEWLLGKDLAHEFIPIMAAGTAILLMFFLISQAVSNLLKNQITPAGLYVSLYVLLIIFWGYADTTGRLLVVILPLLWLILIQSALKFFSEKQSLAVAGALLLLTVWPNVMLVQYSGFLNMRQLSPGSPWTQHWQDYKEAFKWIQNEAEENAGIWAVWDTVVYLRTGHPTAYMHLAALPSDKSDTSLLEYLRQKYNNGIRYLLVENAWQAARPDLKYINKNNLIGKYLIEKYPSNFGRVFTSTHNYIEIYQVRPCKISFQNQHNQGRLVPQDYR